MQWSVNVLYNLSGLLSLRLLLAKINHVPLTLLEAIYTAQTVEEGEVTCKGGETVSKRKCNGTGRLSSTLS